MKVRTQAVFAFLIVVLSTVASLGQAKEQVAQESAEAWLALVDNGNYASSWDQAAELFKAAVTKDQWQTALKTARNPLGKLVSRKLKSASYTKSLPGAPDGEYVVMQYETSFEHKQTAVETITPMLDKDGNWRVSGYFIK